jgi:hypothetical protein
MFNLTRIATYKIYIHWNAYLRALTYFSSLLPTKEVMAMTIWSPLSISSILLFPRCYAHPLPITPWGWSQERRFAEIEFSCEHKEKTERRKGHDQGQQKRSKRDRENNGKTTTDTHTCILNGLHRGACWENSNGGKGRNPMITRCVRATSHFLHSLWSYLYLTRCRERALLSIAQN